MSKKPFASFRDKSAHQYPPAATTETPAPKAEAVKPSAPVSRRVAKLPFSSRISAAHFDLLDTLVVETGKKQTQLLDEALADLFRKYGKT